MSDPIIILGVIAAALTIAYFAKDILSWAWSRRRQISRLLWNRAGFKKKVQKTRIIKVAVAHYPPLSFVSRSLVNKGYEATGPAFDLLKKFSDKNNFKIVVVPLQWHRIEDHFKKEGCHIACPIFPTDSRKTYGRVVAVSHKIGLGAVSLIENSKVTTSANLRDNDVRVAVTEGEIGWEYLRDNYPTKYKSVEALVSKSHDITDTMGAVLQKRADVAIADSISCYRFLKEHDPEGLKLHNPFLNEPLGAFDCGFMVPKREKVFAAWLESELLEIRVDESFLESEAKDLRGWSNLVYRQAPEGVKLPKLG